MRTAALLLLLCVPVPAADPVADFHLAIQDAQAKEAKFFDDFHGMYSKAMQMYEEPWLRSGAEPNYPQDAVWNFDGFRKIYADFVAIEDLRGTAAEALAASGGDRAARALFDEVLDLARRADGADAAMEKDMPPLGHFMGDLKPGILRHGCGRLERRLLPAMAKAPGSAAFLSGEGWKQAVEMDGQKSVLRRVAVIDALGMTGAPAARAFLEKQVAAKGAVIRMAAAEALLRFGPEGTKALVPLLADPCLVARIVLLEGVRAGEKPDPSWILPILASYPASRGRLRGEHVATLRFLTRQEFGDDADRWKEWGQRNGPAIEAGTFDPGKAPVEKVEKPVPPAGPVFYGLRAESLAPIFLLDGSPALRYPAEVDVASTLNRRKWPMRPKGHWDDPPPVNHGVLIKEFERAMAGLLPGSTFGVIGLFGKNEADALAKGRMLRASPAAAAEARDFVEKLDVVGWGGPYEGLKEAARMAKLDPSPSADDFPAPGMLADTVILFHTGVPNGARFVTAEPTVEACERLLRFRRLRVNAVRFFNEKEEAEKTLKGIAEGTGGAYVWARVPPK